MNKIEPVRLLILEESQNRAEELIVLLRTAGRATRAHQVASEVDLIKKLGEQTWDLLLAASDANGVTIARAITIIQDQNKDIPVILLADSNDPGAITEGLKLGAQDVALEDDDDRLVLIIERELANLDHRRLRQKAEEELRETARRNELLLDTSNAAIAYVHEGMHIYTNPAYARLFRFEDRDEFIGIPVIDLIAPDHQEKFKKFLRSFSEDNDANVEDIKGLTSEGSEVEARLTLSYASYDGEECIQMVFRTAGDEVRVAADEVVPVPQKKASGVYNRRSFVEQVDGAVSRAIAGEQQYVMFYIEINNFSKVRSDAGISNADTILKDVASVLSDNVDDRHLIARFGDDSFAILFEGGSKDEAATLAEQIRGGIEQNISEVSGRSFKVTVSVGLTVIDETTPSAEEAVSRAHQAADAITRGNGVNFYQAAQIKVGATGKSITMEAIKELLRKALAENSLCLMYQPIISLHGDEEEQFEVLLRLIDDEGNEIYPEQFMEAGEDAGLLEKIDRWVILQSIKVLSAHRGEGHRTKLFIDISHKSMADKTFLPWVSVALKSARLPSDAIILQLKENDATSYVKHAARFTKGMEQLHCRTAINNFGRADNPLNLLKELTPDYVKLDDSLTDDIESNPPKQREFVSMVKSLQTSGVLTAVTGVESPTILATLFTAGVNFIQGNYISPPLENLDYDFTSEDL